jgi:hypothetical protein
VLPAGTGFSAAGAIASAFAFGAGAGFAKPWVPAPGFAPRVGLEEGQRRTVAWLRERASR